MGTTRGVSTNADGSFELLLESTDQLPLTLRISAIGYFLIEVQADGRSPVRIGLAEDNPNFCDLLISPYASLWLWSGMRYAPFGAGGVLYQRRYFPLHAQLAYQTNLRRNYQLQCELTAPGSLRVAHQRLSGGLSHSHIRVQEAAFRFVSYQLRATVQPPRHSWPSVRLGVGYAQLLGTEGRLHQGMGYELGLSQYISRPQVLVRVSAARWPGARQWQGAISHHFGRIEAEVAANKIGAYMELNLSVGLSLY